MSKTTAGYTADTAPGFCSTIENNLWIGLVAGQAQMSVTIIPNSCAKGLEAAIYESCGAAQPMVCNTGGNQSFSLDFQTEVGKTYLLMVDGKDGDNCDFTVAIPPAMANAPTLAPTPPIIGRNTICPGGRDSFSVAPVSGASHYIWDGPPGSKINGAPPPVTLAAPGGSTVFIQFPPSPSVGVFPICVQPVNSCNDGTVICKNVQIQPIPPTVLPNVTVCAGDPWPPCPCPFVSNSCNCSIPSSQGCDSTFRWFVFERPPIITVLPPVFLCAGDQIEVCGEVFNQAGSYSKVCTSADGCDSTINFAVVINPVTAQIVQAGVTPGVFYPFNSDTICLNPNQPSITLMAAPTTGSLIWYIDGVFAGSGSQILINQPGQVRLCASQQFGATSCTKCDTIQILAGQLLPGTAGPISGPDTLCATELFSLSIDTVAGASEYIWQLPNGYQQVGSGPSIQVKRAYPWSSTGTSDFCVIPADGCNQALKACKTIHFTEGIELQYFMELDCRDTFQYTCGHWNYEQQPVHLHVDSTGCDTLVNVDWLGGPIWSTNLGTITVCYGDTFQLAQNIYTIPGFYRDTFYDPITNCLEGYRSFTLMFVNPIAHIENTIGNNHTTCLSLNQPLIAADSSEFYSWTNSSGQVLSTERQFIPPATGLYYLQASVMADSSICSAFDSVTVLSIDFPIHQVFQTVDCSTLTGTLTVDPFLPTQYTYIWYNAAQQVLGSGQTLDVDTSGTYTVSVEQNGCQAAYSQFINLSPAIQFTYNWVTLYIDEDENCKVSGSDFKASNVYVHAEKVGGGGLTRVSDAQGRVQFPLTEGVYNISIGQQPISNGLICAVQLIIPECSAGTIQDTAFLRMIVSTLEPNKNKSLIISPNPATYTIQLRGDAFAEGAKVNWQIINQLGQVVATQKSQSFPLSLQSLSLPSGVYHVRVEHVEEGYSAFGKFLIAHE